MTDGPFAVQICQGCMVDHKKKNPYWDEVRQGLGRVKKGKQPGPDKLKGEIYKRLKYS